MAKLRAKDAPMHFKTMVQADVPQGRNGKHKHIVTVTLNDLDQLPKGTALKVPLNKLPDGKAKVRSALNRARRKAGRIVATATDETFLYIWNVTSEGGRAVVKYPSRNVAALLVRRASFSLIVNSNRS